MDKKNDWEELEQWNELREEERKNRFGEYPEGFQKNKKRYLFCNNSTSIISIYFIYGRPKSRCGRNNRKFI